MHSPNSLRLSVGPWKGSELPRYYRWCEKCERVVSWPWKAKPHTPLCYSCLDIDRRTIRWIERAVRRGSKSDRKFFSEFLKRVHEDLGPRVPYPIIPAIDNWPVAPDGKQG